MDLMTLNMNTNIYIQSEAAFNRAKSNGAWERFFSRITGRTPNLHSFDEVVAQYDLGHSHYEGLQDIPLSAITGTLDRSKGFTRSFAPKQNDAQTKERWRNIYTLAVTGKGFPPIEVLKVGNEYFVEDGHHRVSVVKYLGWGTIQAQVTTLEKSPASGTVWCQSGCLCPQV